jgi:hypothetical protein
LYQEKLIILEKDVENANQRMAQEEMGSQEEGAYQDGRMHPSHMNQMGLGYSGAGMPNNPKVQDTPAHANPALQSIFSAKVTSYF